MYKANAEWRKNTENGRAFTRKKSKKSYDKNTAKHIEFTKISKLKYPEKVQARIKARYAIKKGILIKQPCLLCGNSVKVEAHHEEYTKQLDVKWLCVKHHNFRHSLEYQNLSWGDFYQKHATTNQF